MAAALHYVTHFPNDVKSLMIGDGPGIAPSMNGSIINKMVDSAFRRFALRMTGAGAFVHTSSKLCYVNYTPNPEELSVYICGCSGRIGPTTMWFKNYPNSLAIARPEKSLRPVLDFSGGVQNHHVVARHSAAWTNPSPGVFAAEKRESVV